MENFTQESLKNDSFVLKQSSENCCEICQNHNKGFFEKLGKEDCWLSSMEAARYLSITENALRIKVFRNQIPAFRLGRSLRFRLKDLRLCLSQKRRKS